MGAHSTYTDEMASAIVEWIAQGKTLREFCRQENTPAWTTVYNWLDAHSAFAERFARARDMGHDAIAEEALAIADTPAAGEITTVEGDKITTRHEDMLGHRKLQIETRLKLLAKWSPRRYGERIEQHVSGELGTYTAQPIPVEERNTDRALAGAAGAATPGDPSR